ncbi:hypothetical protein ILYODFUR_011521 [Ilyodon furcidens]|uniref:Uncharacterized protein n=1 Tax=Ilyodon furcidens TaxID=33524 RepID=A0ABV0SZS0_9TELE
MSDAEEEYGEQAEEIEEEQEAEPEEDEEEAEQAEDDGGEQQEYQDASPRSVPGTSHQKEAQDTLEGLCLSASPVGAERGVWREGSLGISTKSAAPATPFTSLSTKCLGI